MDFIYFNHYRGFDKTFLPLADMNFLVGENSTGKTSVLKLIKALSSDEFWYTGAFNTDDNDLGYFDEIVTSGKSFKFFEVGLFTRNVTLKGCVLKFYEKDNRPHLKDIRWLVDNYEFEFRLKENSIVFRYAPLDFENLDDSGIFEQWINSNNLKNKSYHSRSGEELLYSSKLLLFEIQDIMTAITSNNRRGFMDNHFPVKNLIWTAPIRTEPRRTYDSYKTTYNPDGTHTPYLLKSILDDKNKHGETIEVLKKFGVNSGLFEEIEVNKLGKRASAPFEVRILIDGVSRRITDIGYGVSQILPLIVEAINATRIERVIWFGIQQPEIHLHPRAQAAFGEFLFDSALKGRMKFLVETHSDYVIDRFRLNLSRNKSKSEIRSQVIFFSRDSSGNNFTCIDINQDGNFSESQPKEFREFFIKEELELLTI